MRYLVHTQVDAVDIHRDVIHQPWTRARTHTHTNAYKLGGRETGKRGRKRVVIAALSWPEMVMIILRILIIVISRINIVGIISIVSTISIDIIAMAGGASIL